jgi:RNA polymerase sigma-70 factor (ECF subfamily)
MEADQTIDVAAAWHELGDRLRIYVSRRVNPGDADDVVQSVMVKLLERRGEIDADSVRAWLFTVTRNAVAEYYRRHRPAIDLDSFGDVAETDDTDPSDRAIGSLSDCLDPMLRTLPDADADLLRRIDLHGEAQTELAASLGVPLSTLKSRVQRARTKLRSAFDACCAIDLSRNGAPVAFERRDACPPACATDEKPSSSRC